MRNAKRDNELMRILKLTDISHQLYITPKGPLTLKLVFGGTDNDYVYVLDSIELEKDKQIDLIKLIG